MVKKNFPVEPQCPVPPGGGCCPTPSPVQPISPYVGVRSVNGRTGDIKLNTLTFGDKVYDGSDDKVLKPEDLDLDKAFINRGKKETAQEIESLSDAKIGDVWFCKANELYYLCIGSGYWVKFPSKTYVDNIGGGKLKQSITTTTTVGGIESGTQFAVGTDIESILRQMLMPEQQRTLVSIAVTTPPTKTTYNVGETFNPAGMVVRAYYSDQTSEVVSNYTYSPTTPLTAADTTITISYQGKTTTQTITIQSSTVKVYYGVRENPPVDLSGLTVKQVDKTSLLANGMNITVTTNNEYPVVACKNDLNLVNWSQSGFSLGFQTTFYEDYNLYYLDTPTTDINARYKLEFEANEL